MLDPTSHMLQQTLNNESSVAELAVSFLQTTEDMGSILSSGDKFILKN
jgi:hypothetical protein